MSMCSKVSKLLNNTLKNKAIPERVTNDVPTITSNVPISPFVHAKTRIL
jgi:hypothetical protein